MKFKIDHDESVDLYYIVDDSGEDASVYRCFNNKDDAERFCRLANESLNNLLK